MDSKSKKTFWRGGFLLSLTAIAMRGVGIAFNTYITRMLGADGMGLITLVLSVYGFAVTFATSGISLSATRMVAEALGKGSAKEARAAMNRCILYALGFGITAMLLLFGFAEPIGVTLLGDADTVLSLRVLSPALPCIALSSALTGYFTAVRRVQKAAAKTVFEQAVKIALTAIGLRLLLPRGLRYSCVAVVGGSALAEAVSFLLAWLLYRLDLRKNIGKTGESGRHLTQKLLEIALPVAFTAYVRSGLVTVEHLLIPRGLRYAGATEAEALAGYGYIQSMALPVVLFPLAILTSFTGLLIPEFSEAKARGDREEINRMANSALQKTLTFSAITSILLAVFAMPLGEVLFQSREAGYFILALALLIPTMYFDSTVDAILKGLGEQVYSMKVNILDAALSTLLVALVLPFTGIWGYVGIIWAMEWLNMLLSFRRVKKITTLRLSLSRFLFLPAAVTAAASLFGRFLCEALPSRSFLALFFGLGVSLLLCLFAHTVIALPTPKTIKKNGLFRH